MKMRECLRQGTLHQCYTSQDTEAIDNPIMVPSCPAKIKSLCRELDGSCNVSLVVKKIACMILQRICKYPVAIG